MHSATVCCALTRLLAAACWALATSSSQQRRQSTRSLTSLPLITAFLCPTTTNTNPLLATQQGDSVAVLDSLTHKQGAKQRALVPLYQKAQLAMLRFEHVDVQYIPRLVRGGGCVGVLG